MLHSIHGLNTTKPTFFYYNKILKALPPQILQNLSPKLEPFTLEAGEVIHEPGKSISHLIFPNTAVISLLCTMQSGASAGIGVIGNEGVVGISLFLSGNAAPKQAVALTSGSALRMKSQFICEEFRQGRLFQALLLDYTYSMITQVAQIAACNSLHSLEKRLCRWLLSIHDRLPGDRLQITHEILANLLGVRREGVTVAARRLQEAGLILCSRGCIKIIDRSRLEEAACECYGLIESKFDHLPAFARN